MGDQKQTLVGFFGLMLLVLLATPLFLVGGWVFAMVRAWMRRTASDVAGPTVRTVSDILGLDQAERRVSDDVVELLLGGVFAASQAQRSGDQGGGQPTGG